MYFTGHVVKVTASNKNGQWNTQNEFYFLLLCNVTFWRSSAITSEGGKNDMNIANFYGLSAHTGINTAYLLRWIYNRTFWTFQHSMKTRFTEIKRKWKQNEADSISGSLWLVHGGKTESADSAQPGPGLFSCLISWLFTDISIHNSADPSLLLS